VVRSKQNEKLESKQDVESKSEYASPVEATTQISQSQSKPIAPEVQSGKGRDVGFWKNLGWAIAIILTAATSTTLAALLMWFAPFIPHATAKSSNPSLKGLVQGIVGYRVTRPVNILVMGIDEVPDAPAGSPELFAGRSDTMLLMRLDPEQNVVNVLSIPRDTQVRVPGIGITKINHANMEGGAELAAQTVAENFEGVSIDRYIRVDTSAFKDLVDLLGGVEVYVPSRMKYTDHTQKLYIDLEPGLQVLNGDQAEQFARFRHDATGDIGRVQRQQQLIRALREQVANPTILPKIPEIVQLLQSHIDTNMTMEEMLALANFGLQLERDNFRMVLLPGRFSRPDESVASYWILDPDGKARLMQEFFGVTPDSVLVESTSVTRLSIAVQNATDSPRLGHEVARYLREQGFRNVYVVRDWPEVLLQTEVITQRGDLGSAQQLQSILQLGQVIPASTGDLESDLTIRVGEDWLQQQEQLEIQ